MQAVSGLPAAIMMLLVLGGRCSAGGNRTLIQLARRRVQMEATVHHYHVSTEAKYATSEAIFVGKYQHTRAVLDYSWHAHYTPARQLVQDGIVDLFLSGGVTVERPWIVYTAGPMGAGKSFTVRFLNKSGAFPLDRFVQIDPDKIKGLLPDMPAYIKHNREMAGSLTHKESGFIAEIIERQAMEQSKPILVDGSLRNSDWYARAFGRFRAEFPQYRIAILLVQAPAATIYERARRRGAVTGREVPCDVLDDAIANVPASFAALRPLVDFSAVIANEDDKGDPTFEPPITKDGFTRVWDEIAAAPRPAALAGLAALHSCSSSGGGLSVGGVSQGGGSTPVTATSRVDEQGNVQGMRRVQTAAGSLHHPSQPQDAEGQEGRGGGQDDASPSQLNLASREREDRCGQREAGSSGDTTTDKRGLGNR